MSQCDNPHPGGVYLRDLPADHISSMCWSRSMLYVICDGDLYFFESVPSLGHWSLHNRERRFAGGVQRAGPFGASLSLKGDPHIITHDGVYQAKGNGKVLIPHPPGVVIERLDFYAFTSEFAVVVTRHKNSESCAVYHRELCDTKFRHAPSVVPIPYDLIVGVGFVAGSLALFTREQAAMLSPLASELFSRIAHCKPYPETCTELIYVDGGMRTAVMRTAADPCMLLYFSCLTGKNELRYDDMQLHFRLIAYAGNGNYMVSDPRYGCRVVKCDTTDNAPIVTTITNGRREHVDVTSSYKHPQFISSIVSHVNETTAFPGIPVQTKTNTNNLASEERRTFRIMETSGNGLPLLSDGLPLLHQSILEIESHRDVTRVFNCPGSRSSFLLVEGVSVSPEIRGLYHRFDIYMAETKDGNIARAAGKCIFSAQSNDNIRIRSLGSNVTGGGGFSIHCVNPRYSDYHEYTAQGHLTFARTISHSFMVFGSLDSWPIDPTRRHRYIYYENRSKTNARDHVWDLEKNVFSTYNSGGVWTRSFFDETGCLYSFRHDPIHSRNDLSLHRIIDGTLYRYGHTCEIQHSLDMQYALVYDPVHRMAHQITASNTIVSFMVPNLSRWSPNHAKYYNAQFIEKQNAVLSMQRHPESALYCLPFELVELIMDAVIAAMLCRVEPEGTRQGKC